MAEHIGFEPMRDISAPAPLAEGCLRPLGQCSNYYSQTLNCEFDRVLSCVTVSINLTKYLVSMGVINCNLLRWLGSNQRLLGLRLTAGHITTLSHLSKLHFLFCSISRNKLWYIFFKRLD
jgi:hypothetical protein